MAGDSTKSGEDWHDEHRHRRGELVLLAIAAIGAFFLNAEHGAHAFALSATTPSRP
jgi:hypothetical protein